MSDSTVHREQRDAKKLALKAAGYQQRIEMMKNASSRKAGVDPASCQEIIAEKNAARLLDRESDRQQASENKRINLILAKAELDDVQRRQNELQDIKSTWQEQSDRRNRTEADLDPKLSKPQPINPECCGLSAVYNLAGEDRGKNERTRLQQRQITKWTQQQIQEKKSKESSYREEDMNYSRYLQDIDKIRDRIETAAEQEAAQTRKANQTSNVRLARDQRNRRGNLSQEEQAANQAEMEANLNNPLLCEVQTRNPNGRIRRDNYKGLSSEEVRAIYDENRGLVEENRRNATDSKLEDKQWVKQQKMISRVIAEAEINEQTRRETELHQQKAAHFAQMKDARKREESNKEASRGSFEAGFFGKFGASHR